MIIIVHWFCIIHGAVTAVSFSQSIYNVNEVDGIIELVLVLRNALPTNVTIMIRNDDNDTTGKYFSVLVYY